MCEEIARSPPLIARNEEGRRLLRRRRRWLPWRGRGEQLVFGAIVLAGGLALLLLEMSPLCVRNGGQAVRRCPQSFIVQFKPVQFSSVVQFNNARFP